MTAFVLRHVVERYLRIDKRSCERVFPASTMQLWTSIGTQEVKLKKLYRKIFIHAKNKYCIQMKHGKLIPLPLLSSRQIL